MTRETKIGLLVGLAFIIVIGVLLSDHIQSATQPVPAPIVGVTEGVDRSVLSPGKQDPGAVLVRAPETVTPIGRVTTRDSISDLAQGGGRGEPMVSVGGPGGATRGTTEPGHDAVLVSGGTGPVNSGETAVLDGRQNGGVTNIGPVADGTSATADARGMSMMATGPMPITTPDQDLMRAATGNTGGRGSTPGESPTTGPSAGQGGATKYTAVAGDNVYKMTVKFYGGYTKAREAMILAENPDMKGNPSKIAVGKVYNIPALPGEAMVAGAKRSATVVASSAAKPGGETVVRGTPAPLPTGKREPTTPARSVRTYVVKEGDSLWKIASATGQSITELRAANKDVLKGSENLRPGMTLKVPQERVAVAAQ